MSVAGKCWVDFGFHGGAVGPAKGTSDSASTPEKVRELIRAGILGLKVFQCDSGLDEFPAITRHELEWLMPILAEHDVPLWSHAELIPNDWQAPMMPTQLFALAGRSLERFRTRARSTN